MSAGSLWEALDDALIAAFMGDAGLALQAAEVGDTWKPDGTAKPALLLVSNNAEQTQTQHGAGSPVDGRLEYMAVAYAEAGSHRDAKRQAQAMQRRIIAILRNWPAIIREAQQAAPEGEAAGRLSFDRTRIEIRGRQGATKAGTWVSRLCALK